MNISQRAAALFQDIQVSAQQIAQYIPQKEILFMHKRGQTTWHSDFFDANPTLFTAHQKLEFQSIVEDCASIGQFVHTCQAHPLISHLFSKDDVSFTLSFFNNAQQVHLDIDGLFDDDNFKFFTGQDALFNMLSKLPITVKQPHRAPLYFYNSPSHRLYGPYSLHTTDLEALFALCYPENSFSRNVICEKIDGALPTDGYLLKKISNKLTVVKAASTAPKTPNPKAVFYKPISGTFQSRPSTDYD